MASWVIWFKDGRYTYSFGNTAEEARENYLKQWADGISRVQPAGEVKSQLAPNMYVPTIEHIKDFIESLEQNTSGFGSPGLRGPVTANLQDTE